MTTTRVPLVGTPTASLPARATAKARLEGAAGLAVKKAAVSGGSSRTSPASTTAARNAVDGADRVKQGATAPSGLAAKAGSPESNDAASGPERSQGASGRGAAAEAAGGAEVAAGEASGEAGIKRADAEPAPQTDAPSVSAKADGRSNEQLLASTREKLIKTSRGREVMAAVERRGVRINVMSDEEFDRRFNADAKPGGERVGANYAGGKREINIPRSARGRGSRHHNARARGAARRGPRG